MKKRLSVFGFCMIMVMAMVVMTACGGGGIPYSQYDLDEYIKVADYKGLEVDGYSIVVSEKEVKAQIDEAIQASVKNTDLKKGTVLEKGDTVNIDYVGRVNGKKFEGGSAEGQDLVLGSGEFIPGFEDGLIGKKVGDKKIKVPVTFPNDYNAEELQGKDAVFTININSATRPEEPEYNDAFAKTQGDYKNIEEYEKAIKDSIYKQKEAEAINEQKTALWDKVLGDSKVKKYPQDEVDNYIKCNDEQMDAMAKEYGINRNQILSKYGFKDEEDFRLSNEESSKLRVKQELIIMKIAENEDISFTDEEKAEMLEQFESQGYDEETIEEQTGRSADDYIAIQLLYEKVMDFILDNAEVKK